MIAFKCPSCGRTIEAADGLARSRLECPYCKGTFTVPAATLAAGMVVGGYRIEEHIGSGGFGDVYRATQLSVDRRVALKILSPSVTKEPESVSSFLREARMLAKLDHPTLVTVFDAGEDHGLYYLATSFVDGEDLATRIARKGAFPEREALRIALKVAETLGFIWEKHTVLHNDVTPANIMIDVAGDVHLLDVGLSQHLQRGKRVAKAAKFVGTPNYVSPEYAEGERVPDFRTDIYSLGATLHHMLTGALPHAGADPEAILTRLVFKPLPPVRSKRRRVSTGTSKLVARMTAPQALQRPQSWDEVVRDLKRLLASPSAPVKPATKEVRPLGPGGPGRAGKAPARPALKSARASIPPRLVPPRTQHRQFPWALVVSLVIGAAVVAFAVRHVVRAEEQRTREAESRRMAAEEAARTAQAQQHLQDQFAAIELLLAADPPRLDAAERRVAELRREFAKTPPPDDEWTRRLNRFAAAIQDKRFEAAAARRAGEREAAAKRNAEARAADLLPPESDAPAPAPDQSLSR